MKTQSSKGRRERKKELLRQEIIKKAIFLFEKSSFEQVTMESIAASCDITKATLYKYFPAKESILVAQWQDQTAKNKIKFQKIIAENSDTRARLLAVLQFSMRQIMKHRELYSVYLSYRLQHLNNLELSQQLRSGIADTIVEIIRAGQEAGEIRADVPVGALIGNFELLHVMQSVSWLYQEKGFSVVKTSEMLVDLFINGARAEK